MQGRKKNVYHAEYVEILENNSFIFQYLHVKSEIIQKYINVLFICMFLK